MKPNNRFYCFRCPLTSHSVENPQTKNRISWNSVTLAVTAPRFECLLQHVESPVRYAEKTTLAVCNTPKKGFQLFSVADCASRLFLVGNKASMDRCFSDSDLGNLEVMSALDGFRRASSGGTRTVYVEFSTQNSCLRDGRHQGGPTPWGFV